MPRRGSFEFLFFGRSPRARKGRFPQGSAYGRKSDGAHDLAGAERYHGTGRGVRTRKKGLPNGHALKKATYGKRSLSQEQGEQIALADLDAVFVVCIAAVEIAEAYAVLVVDRLPVPLIFDRADLDPVAVL